MNRPVVIAAATAAVVAAAGGGYFWLQSAPPEPLPGEPGRSEIGALSPAPGVSDAGDPATALQDEPGETGTPPGLAPAASPPDEPSAPPAAGAMDDAVAEPVASPPAASPPVPESALPHEAPPASAGAVDVAGAEPVASPPAVSPPVPESALPHEAPPASAGAVDVAGAEPVASPPAASPPVPESALPHEAPPASAGAVDVAGAEPVASPPAASPPVPESALPHEALPASAGAVDVAGAEPVASPPAASPVSAGAMDVAGVEPGELPPEETSPIPDDSRSEKAAPSPGGGARGTTNEPVVSTSAPPYAGVAPLPADAPKENDKTAVEVAALEPRPSRNGDIPARRPTSPDAVAAFERQAAPPVSPTLAAAPKSRVALSPSSAPSQPRTVGGVAVAPPIPVVSAELAPPPDGAAPDDPTLPAADDALAESSVAGAPVAPLIAMQEPTPAATAAAPAAPGSAAGPDVAAALDAAASARPPAAPPAAATELEAASPRFENGPRARNVRFGAEPGRGSAPAPVVAIAYEETALVFAGKTIPGAVVEAWIDGRPVGAVTAGPEGNWRLPAAGNEPGQRRLLVTTTGPEGEMGRLESPIFIEDAARVSVSRGLTVVQVGSNLWRIAREVYGRGARNMAIYEANRDQIRDPDVIFPGQILILPGASSEG